MPKKEIDVYEIDVKLFIRKDYWDAEKSRIGNIGPKVLKDLIQSGIEVPIESIKVTITD